LSDRTLRELLRERRETIAEGLALTVAVLFGGVVYGGVVYVLVSVTLHPGRLAFGNRRRGGVLGHLHGLVGARPDRADSVVVYAQRRAVHTQRGSPRGETVRDGRVVLPLSD
jgi:hypothetical protein